ncbi:MAG: DUF47 family protein [Candidatus Gastranaerophilales bacterium]|nr:DUF47 family protein [Candidatus Gastranaerophilales bacterium]
MSKLMSGIMSYILPPSNDVFYSLFEEGTKCCKQASELLHEILESGNITEEQIARARQYKHASSKNIKKTLEVLDTSFVTPIDREDIQNISSLLNKITKKITKSCMNLKVYRLEKYTENLKKQSQTLIAATSELELIFSTFKKPTISDMTAKNLKMKEIETRGDEILLNATEALFSGKYDALNVIKLRDLHKDLENALDACYAVSDAVVSVVLKLS